MKSNKNFNKKIYEEVLKNQPEYVPPEVDFPDNIVDLNSTMSIKNEPEEVIKEEKTEEE